MASRDIKKMQFPVLDMLRNEQKEKKNVSVEKDDFSEVVKEDFQKKVRKFRTNLEETKRFILGHFLLEILWNHEKFRKNLKENRNISIQLEATKDLSSYVASLESRKEIKDLLSLFNCKWLYCKSFYQTLSETLSLS